MAWKQFGYSFHVIYGFVLVCYFVCLGFFSFLTGQERVTLYLSLKLPVNYKLQGFIWRGRRRSCESALTNLVPARHSCKTCARRRF